MRGRVLVALVVGCVCLSTGASPRRASAECAVQALVAEMLTPSSATLPRDGGAVVVGLRSRPAPAPRPLPSSIPMTRGRRAQELVGTEIAPGLVRYAAQTRLTTGSFTTAVLAAPATLTIGARTPLPGQPTRPALRDLRRVAVTSARGQHAEIRGGLEFPVPEGIVALLIYWGETGTAPASWVPATQGQTEVLIWAERSGCDAGPPPGSTPPPASGGVGRIAYVDAFGQISPPSNAVPVM
jgi:hypothetical protein